MIAGFNHSLKYLSHSYETVASILGPSGSSVAEVVHHPKALSSSVDREDNSPPLVGKAVPLEEPQFEGMLQTNQSIKFPTSAEPYMWNLADDRSVSPSPTTDSDDGFLGVVGPSIMKKWPPLTEADITEISKEDLEGEGSKEGACFDPYYMKERLFTEQDSVQTSVFVEGLDQAKTGQGDLITESASALLDKG